MVSPMIKVLVSSCLLGAPVRYDGRDKKSEHRVLQRWLEEGRVVAACPEMLGGLGTPRLPSEIVAGSARVIANDGTDVTGAFEAGAAAALDQARNERIRVAVLKEGSPSCGTTFVYDGTFSKTAIPGAGVTAALLRSHGIEVFSEEQFELADERIAALERG